MLFNAVKLIRKIFDFHRGDDMIDHSTYNMYVRRIVPLVVHPSKWIRNEALEFIRIIIVNFPPAHVFLKFHKIFQVFFIEDIILLKSEMVQYAFQDPLSRSDYDKLMGNHLFGKKFDFSDKNNKI